jgi:hypothetical protein
LPGDAGHPDVADLMSLGNNKAAMCGVFRAEQGLERSVEVPSAAAPAWGHTRGGFPLIINGNAPRILDLVGQRIHPRYVDGNSCRQRR